MGIDSVHTGKTHYLRVDLGVTSIPSERLTDSIPTDSEIIMHWSCIGTNE